MRPTGFPRYLLFSLALILSLAAGPRPALAEYAGFSDLWPGHWAVPDVVDWASAHGVVNGYPDGSWRPDEPVTREVAAAMASNYAKGDGRGLKEGFRDVSDADWSRDAIAWAKASLVMSGYSDLEFGPRDAVTREQVAALVRNLLGGRGKTGDASTLSGFRDSAEVSPWAVESVRWAVANGVVSGRGGTTLAPRDTCTRAELAAMLRNADAVVGGELGHVHTWVETRKFAEVRDGLACNYDFTDVTDWPDPYACHGGYHTHQWCEEPGSEYACRDCGAERHAHWWTWVKPIYLTGTNQVIRRGYWFCWRCFSFSEDGLTMDNSDRINLNSWVTPYDFSGRDVTFTVDGSDPRDDSLVATRIDVTSGPRSVSVGETARYAVTATPAGAPLGEVAWQSSDPSVLPVSADGSATALSAGTATLTARTAGGLSNSIFVRVFPSPGENAGSVSSAALVVDGREVADGSTVALTPGSSHSLSLATSPARACYEVTYSSTERSVSFTGSIRQGDTSLWSWEHGPVYTDPATEFTTGEAGSSSLVGARVLDMNGRVTTLSITVTVAG